MKYLDKSFTVTPGTSDKYRENYDKVFGKKKAEKAAEAAACKCTCHKDKSERHEMEARMKEERVGGTGMHESMQVTYSVRALFSQDPETGMWVGVAPGVRVYAQGEDEPETRYALKDSLMLYFAEHFKYGSIHGQLNGYGWTPVTGPISLERNDYASVVEAEPEKGKEEYLDVTVDLEQRAA